MNETSQKLYELAKKAIEKLYGETSIPPEDTKELLETLQDDIEIMLLGLSSMIQED